MTAHRSPEPCVRLVAEGDERTPLRPRLVSLPARPEAYGQHGARHSPSRIGDEVADRVVVTLCHIRSDGRVTRELDELPRRAPTATDSSATKRTCATAGARLGRETIAVVAVSTMRKAPSRRPLASMTGIPATSDIRRKIGWHGEHRRAARARSTRFRNGSDA